jgi:hypothetical protein
MHLEEHPARLHEKSFEPGDFQIIFGGNGRILAHACLSGGFGGVERAEAQTGEGAGDYGSARDWHDESTLSGRKPRSKPAQEVVS